MKSHLFKRIGSSLIALFMVALAITVQTSVEDTSAAAGASPPWVRNDHLLPGSTYEQIVNLSRSNPTTRMQIKSQILGDKELKKWITIEDQDNLFLERGQTIIPMKVIVKVPRRAALKDYVGDIFVTFESAEPESTQGGNVSIKLGAHVAVELSVIGDKVTDYRFVSATLEPLEEGEPFALNVSLENLGNTDIETLDGQLDIYNYEETEVLNSLTFGQLSEAVSPDENTVSQIVFDDLVLQPGEYWVKVKVFKDGEETYSTRLFQQVEQEYVPVITPEDVRGEVSKPKLPSLPPAPGAQEPEEQPAPAEQLKESADEDDRVRAFMVFGIAGFAFGALALIAVGVLAFVIIKRQRQATIQHYLSEQKSQQPNQTTTPNGTQQQ